MAGHARAALLRDTLAKRALDYFADDDSDVQPTGLDFVSGWLADGRTVKSLAQQLTDQLGYEVYAESLLRHLRREFGEVRVDREMDEARVRASHRMAEDALDIIDTADGDSASAVSKASSQARSRQWMAERYNPSRYGQVKGPTVSISVGSLHLAALQSTTLRVTGSDEQPAQPLPITSGT